MVTTFQQHIVTQTAHLSASSIEIQWLLSGIVLAAKLIQSKVRRAGLVDILGALESENMQGEVQQKLDVYANETLINCFRGRESIGVIASEENEHPIVLRRDLSNAEYAVVFDPLDGSSNIDVAVTIGTTFSIFCRPENADENDPLNWILQTGRRQIARRICRLWFFDRSGLQHRKRRSRFYARSGNRNFYFDSRKYTHSRTRKLLFDQRSSQRKISRKICRVHKKFEKREKRKRLFIAFYRFDGRRFSPHIIARRNFSLSGDHRFSRRQTAAFV